MEFFLGAHWELWLCWIHSRVAGILPTSDLFNISKVIPWLASVFGICLVPGSILLIWNCWISVVFHHFLTTVALTHYFISLVVDVVLSLDFQKRREIEENLQIPTAFIWGINKWYSTWLHSDLMERTIVLLVTAFYNLIGCRLTERLREYKNIFYISLIYCQKYFRIMCSHEATWFRSQSSGGLSRKSNISFKC